MRRPIIFALAAATLVAACGGDTTTTAQSGDPVATTAAAPHAVAQRIVSLSPTATEMLFAIGAGDQVVAVDDQSDFPPGVPTTDLSGFEPNVEAIAVHRPDLVIMSSVPDDVQSGLDALNIEVLAQDAAVTLDDTYNQLAELGIATGHEDEAAAVVTRMRADIDDLVATVPERDQALTYYHELDDTLFSVTSATFIGELYALAGLENVADPADADGSLGGFPQLSAEFLVDADPDLIFLADTECCGQSAETIAARPGFAGLTAVRDGRVVQLSDDVASRWGPRVVDFLRTIIEATAEVPVS